MDYCVEETFVHDGLICCITINLMGIRCGYVGVTERNSVWGNYYNDIYDEMMLDDYPDVHGDLTYSSNMPDQGYPIETDNNIWWFGFDCGHSGDSPDQEAVEKYFPECKNLGLMLDWGHDEGDTVCSKEYVHNECVKLADWLSSYSYVQLCSNMMKDEYDE